MSEEYPLAEQLAAAREAFRQERADRERADLEKRRADIDQRAERLKAMRAEVRVEREKVRKTYRRYLKRMKAKWSVERMSVASARAAIDRDRADLTRQQDQFHADRNRQTEQLSEYKRRLYQAWELLAENQRRLLADRQQAEAWIAHQTATADRRVRESLEREQRLNDALSGLEGRRAAAAAEIVGLETRAANLRAAVQRLETSERKGSVGRTKPNWLPRSNRHRYSSACPMMPTVYFPTCRNRLRPPTASGRR